MTSYGHAYLTSYGWTGAGTGLRKGAISKPLAIPPKKNLSGLGKDRDEAFPFWDHLFTAASKAITIRVSSDDEDANDTQDHSLHTELQRTTTGIISNRRPISVTPASTSGSSTPNPNLSTGASVAGRLSLLTTAKREAAKRGLYSRFFRGPVLGPHDDPPVSVASDAGSSPVASSSSTPVCESTGEQDRIAGETEGGKKRKSEDKAETEEARRERKRLKRGRKAAKAAKRLDKALAKKTKQDKKLGIVHRKDGRTRIGEIEISPCSRKTRDQAQRSLAGDTPSRRPDAIDATSNVVLTTKKKVKRKNIPP